MEFNSGFKGLNLAQNHRFTRKANSQRTSLRGSCLNSEMVWTSWHL